METDVENKLKVDLGVWLVEKNKTKPTHPSPPTDGLDAVLHVWPYQELADKVKTHVFEYIHIYYLIFLRNNFLTVNYLYTRELFKKMNVSLLETVPDMIYDIIHKVSTVWGISKNSYESNKILIRIFKSNGV